MEVSEADVFEFLLKRPETASGTLELEWCDIDQVTLACRSFQPEAIVPAIIGAHALARIMTLLAQDDQARRIPVWPMDGLMVAAFTKHFRNARAQLAREAREESTRLRLAAQSDAA
jgi:hypothetical protein